MQIQGVMGDILSGRDLDNWQTYETVTGWELENVMMFSQMKVEECFKQSVATFTHPLRKLERAMAEES